jgi:hypothetical protein
MAVLNVVLVGATIYCSWAIDNELSRYGYQEDTGLFVDPRFDYLKPFRIHLLFLRYGWIAFVILGVLWIAVGIWWFRTKRKRRLPEESLSLRGVTTTFSRWFARRAGIIWVPTTLTFTHSFTSISEHII